MGTIRSTDLKPSTITKKSYILSPKMSPIIAHYKTNNFPTAAFEPLEVETGNMDEAPMSRTHQYRKVMKPLLERKRRARINKCLDEIKDLMVYALQSEGESVNKLEKADVLELTPTFEKIEKTTTIASQSCLRHGPLQSWIHRLCL